MKQYSNLPYQWYYSTCPRCGKGGCLTTKTTISKRKYAYKKWYFYHNVYPDPKRPKFRKQKWCYLNKKQLEEPTLKQKIQKIEEWEKKSGPLLEEIQKRDAIICPICNLKLRLNALVNLFRSSKSNVVLICDEGEHQISINEIGTLIYPYRQ
jgi:hypothetical protein